MIIKIAEYKMKDGVLNVVTKAIAKFVREIKKHEPETLYEAFRRSNSLEFVHLMKFPDRISEKKHASAPYTREFVRTLYPHCEREPVFTDLRSVE